MTAQEQRLLSNNGRTIRNASPFCRSLLLDMFIWDYTDRPGIREAFDHPWFRQSTVVGDGGDSVPVAAGSLSRGPPPPPRSISPPHQCAYQYHSHHQIMNYLQLILVFLTELFLRQLYFPTYVLLFSSLSYTLRFVLNICFHRNAFNYWCHFVLFCSRFDCCILLCNDRVAFHCISR